jgi:hypothetical protein
MGEQMNSSVISKYALLVVFAFLAQGCVISRYYEYDGQRYSTSEAAHNAQKLRISEDVAGVKKNSPYVGGKALVFIPPRHVLAENGVAIRGNAPNEVVEEMTNHAVVGLENAFSGMAEQ